PRRRRPRRSSRRRGRAGCARRARAAGAGAASRRRRRSRSAGRWGGSGVGGGASGGPLVGYAWVTPIMDLCRPRVKIRPPMPLAPGLSLRRAGPRDAAPIAELNRRLAEESEGLALDPARLRAGVEALLGDAGKGFYLVVEEGDRIVGQLML